MRAARQRAANRGALRIVTVRGEARRAHAESIRALGASASYPLGTDRFRIDRGDDVFAFLDRMGEATLELALDGDRVVAMSARVLRPGRRRCWYLCDLKVHPDHRGRRITARFVRHAFARAYARCGRGYAVTMDPVGAAGAANPVVQLVGRIGFVPFRRSGLEVYDLDENEARAHAALLEAHRGPVRYESLAGVKDLVLQSTGAPIPLLHARFGPDERDGSAGPDAGRTPGGAPRQGHRHMLCAPEGSPLARALAGRGLRPSATATVLHHRMDPAFLDTLLTSEI